MVSWFPLKEENPKYSFKGPDRSNAGLFMLPFLVVLPVTFEDDFEEAMNGITET